MRLTFPFRIFLVAQLFLIFGCGEETPKAHTNENFSCKVNDLTGGKFEVECDDEIDGFELGTLNVSGGAHMNMSNLKFPYNGDRKKIFVEPSMLGANKIKVKNAKGKSIDLDLK